MSPFCLPPAPPPGPAPPPSDRTGAPAMATWGTTLIVGVVRACVADGNEALEGPESSSLGDEIYENRANLITSCVHVCVCMWMRMCVHMTVCVLCM